MELTVEVLGTSFNINAYETNPYVNATLVEGNVRVHLAESRKDVSAKARTKFTIGEIIG